MATEKELRQARREWEERARNKGFSIGEPERPFLSTEPLRHGLRRSFGEPGVGILFGPYGCLKSTLLDYLIWADQNDLPFLGLPPTGSGAVNVLLVAPERPETHHERLSGLRERALAHRESAAVPLILSSPAIDLRREADVAEIASLVEARAAFLPPDEEELFSVIAIDTIQKAGGLDFNVQADADIAKVIDGAKALAGRLGASWVWLVTHTGYDTTHIKGSTKWYEEPDLVLGVERPDRAVSRGRVVFHKDRLLGREGQALEFRVDWVDAVGAKPGDPPSVPLVRAASDPVEGRALASTEDLARFDRVALELLKRLLGDPSVREVPGAQLAEKIRASASCEPEGVVPRAIWRARFLEAYDGAKESGGKTFSRSTERLAKNRMVFIVDDFAFAP